MPRNRNASPINLVLVIIAITLGIVVGVYMFLPDSEAPAPVEPIAEVVEEPTVTEDPEPTTVTDAEPTTPALPEVAAETPAPPVEPTPLPVEVVEPVDDAPTAPQPEEDPADDVYPDWLLGDVADEEEAPEPDEPVEVADEPAVEEAVEILEELSEIIESPEPAMISGEVDSDDPVRFSGTVRNHLGEIVPNGSLFVIAQSDGSLSEKVRRAFASSHTHTIVRSNSQGRFQFKIPAGKVFLIGPMVSGEPQSIVTEIGPELPGAVVESDIEMPRPFTLRGAVTNRAGLRLEGIPVKVTWEPTSLRGRAPEPRTINISSDEEGYFDVILPEVSKATVVVDADQLPRPYLFDAPPRQVQRSDFQSNRYYRVTLEVITGVNLQGRVIEEDGDTDVPLFGALVELTPVGDGGLQRDKAKTIYTDRDGVFHFETLYPRRYLLTASMDGFNQGVLRDFLPESDQAVEIVLRPLTMVAGTVSLPREMDEMVSAQVNLLGRRGGSHRQTIEIDPETRRGEWSFDEISSGSYLLAIQAEDAAGRNWYHEDRVVVMDGALEEPSNVVLNQLWEIPGRFTTAIPGGGNYEDLEVIARLRERDSDSLFPPRFQPEFRRLPKAEVAPDGSFLLKDLKEGMEYRIQVVRPDSDSRLGGAILVAGADKVSKPLEVSLEGTGSVSGRVFNDRNESCSGVTITLTAGLGTMEGMAGSIQRRTATVGYDGKFSFDAVPVGNARISIEGDDITGRLFYVPFNQEVELELECRTWVDVDFALKDPSNPITEREHFLVIAQPGTVVKDPIRELHGNDLRSRLEPGRYVITRTSTMESRSFEVLPRLDGTISITFGSQ
ncbi:MAG: hypothetical protein JJU11_12735 [Candidatus Sumerlaeia bacterium]|nr:hypothetical protein [Candidatus Sumerlaeia bacterium]